MVARTAKFKLGPWLPDKPDLDNPGILVAKNVLPIGSGDVGYAPYKPIATAGNALTTTNHTRLITLLCRASNGQDVIYVGDVDGNVYQSIEGSGTWTDYSGAVLSNILALAQYNTQVFVADGAHGIYSQTVGTAVNFAAASGSPNCSALGTIGQFLFAGNISATPNTYPNRVAWSGINNPTSWPTPGSATAIAQQSGQQDLHMDLGDVTGIYGADQWGVILQSAGITRVNYTGNDTVFQFDTLASGIGMDNAGAGLRVGNQVYFVSSKGFWGTDGTSLFPIGEEKVNRWFVTALGGSIQLAWATCAADWKNKLILWVFPGSNPNPVIVAYNFEQDRFAWAADANLAALIPGDDSAFSAYGLQGIGIDGKRGTFTGTPGTATLTTGEVELNPGGKALVQGFRPLVSDSSSITCKIGSRMRESDVVTYSSAITPNTNTGFADCLIEANYHRVEIDITGTFTQALGGEFIAQPSGAF